MHPWKTTFFLIAALSQSAPAEQCNYETSRNFFKLTENKVFRNHIQAHWLTNNTQFWYQVKTGPDTHEFVFVDAEKAIKQPAFDHERLAHALTDAGIKEITPTRLPIERLEFTAGTLSKFRLHGQTWTCDSATYVVHEEGPAQQESLAALVLDDAPRASVRTGQETSLTLVNHTEGEVELFWLNPEGQRQSYGKLKPGDRRGQHTFSGHVWVAADQSRKTLLVYEADDDDATVEITTTPTGHFHPRHHHAESRSHAGNSPDGAWNAIIKDNNVWLKKLPDGQELQLSTDGNSEDGYTEPFYWSPDAKKLVVLRSRKADEHKIHIVESSPRDQIQPRLHTIDYQKPGDRVQVDRPQLFDIETAKQLPVDNALFSNPWSVSDVRWQPDSSRFTFVYNERGHQILRILAVDATNGHVCPVIEEKSDTFIDYSGKFYAEYLDDTGEIIWMAERDGWNHLYLYDSKTGHLKNQITCGEWVVRGVDRVDHEKRQIWFRAGGIIPKQDPYYVHFCRINFDGTGLVVLTDGDGTHNIEYSPDHRFLIDSYSRVDMPPTHELRREDNGKLVCELEHADWKPLLAAGWRAPERFVAKGRDSQSDIYGVIMRPTHFDPAQHYPVIENIYAGPQDSFVPKAFNAFNSMQELAELGFIVVQIDGMGTSNRSKKFHDVCWKNLVDGGFPDRIAWMKAAAATRPWMDLDHVGIYGTSAGGQNALGALLTHGEFYKAGVADCGCHDNRMDKIWWNEQWMGWPVGPHYAEQSNVTLAHRLQGKLFLMVGEMDTNVDPASTMQVVNALIKADKDFDLLVVPGAGHGVAGSPYGKRRLQEFFVKNLR